MDKKQHIRKSANNRELIKEQKEHKQSVTVYLEPQVVQVLKQEAKKRLGMFFHAYLEQVLVEKAKRIKERNND